MVRRALMHPLAQRHQALPRAGAAGKREARAGLTATMPGSVPPPYHPQACRSLSGKHLPHWG